MGRSWGKLDFVLWAGGLGLGRKNSFRSGPGGWGAAGLCLSLWFVGRDHAGGLWLAAGCSGLGSCGGNVGVLRSCGNDLDAGWGVRVGGPASCSLFYICGVICLIKYIGRVWLVAGCGCRSRVGFAGFPGLALCGIGIVAGWGAVCLWLDFWPRAGLSFRPLCGGVKYVVRFWFVGLAGCSGLVAGVWSSPCCLSLAGLV